MIGGLLSFSSAKTGVTVLWVVCLASFLVSGGSPVALVGRTLFWILVVTHAVECLVFLPMLRRAPGPLTRQLVHTFIFGVVHLREVRAALRESATEP